MTINDWLVFYMIAQFDEYIYSANYFTIPLFNIKIPVLYQTQNGKTKVEAAEDINRELSLILDHQEPDLKKSAQVFVDLTVLSHKEALEKLRIDSKLTTGRGKLEKLIQMYFYLLKNECPLMQRYSASFLAEADFQMISFNKQDCRKYLITFLVKQYFMCCVELEKISIINCDEKVKSIAEDAHFPALKQLIFDALKTSDKFQDNKLDLIRVIDDLVLKVANDAILSKKTHTDPLLKNFLDEIGILKAMIGKFMREEPVNTASAQDTVLGSAKANALPIVDKKAHQEITGLQASQSGSMQSASSAVSLQLNDHQIPLIMSQATGSQSADALCRSVGSTDSTHPVLVASFTSLEAACVISQDLLPEKKSKI